MVGLFGSRMHSHRGRMGTRRTRRVYNLTVGNVHTYYVGMGGVLGHNCHDYIPENNIEHIFSTSHIKDGIMDLGIDRGDIMKKINLSISDNKNLFIDGMNTIQTKMNGHNVTVRVFINNSNVMSVNAFKGVATRHTQNLITSIEDYL